ncbi:hypothetical protein HAX54_007077 [Datura stramonium]|uniref:Uncharacterized protein n=1 Tax=Datura stramonium TaxID=4076 RepID=A0ABS8TB73_DATST|nr:hypothetical protein [Datura stramonium]
MSWWLFHMEMFGKPSVCSGLFWWLRIYRAMDATCDLMIAEVLRGLELAQVRQLIRLWMVHLDSGQRLGVVLIGRWTESLVTEWSGALSR